MRYSICFLSLSAALMLGACGTMAEGQTQDITLHTPGASNARCILDNGLRYPIETGQTIQIMRSFHAMEVDCYAVGNRHMKKTIPAGPNPWSAANVANAGTGVAYDAASMGLYTYPDVITVDFTGMPTNGFELPDYMNRDMPNPYERAVENMGPNTIKGPDGIDYLPRGVERRSQMGGNPFSGQMAPANTPAAASSTAPAMTPSKEGVTMKPAGVPTGRTAEELTRSANPTVFNQ